MPRGIEGSNPSLSATEAEEMSPCGIFFISREQVFVIFIVQNITDGLVHQAFTYLFYTNLVKYIKYIYVQHIPIHYSLWSLSVKTN
jgi:hypothetical protein